jgi:hypothetical protein
MNVNAYSEGRLKGVQKNKNINATIKKNRFVDWFTRKTQKVSPSLKPIRMVRGVKPSNPTKPEHKTSAPKTYTRKSRKSVVPDFDEPMSWVPNRAKSPSNSATSPIHSLISHKDSQSAMTSAIKKDCDMTSIIPSHKVPCSYLSNLTINTFLNSYLTKTPDNSGWVLDLSTGKSTVGIVMGKKNCDAIRKNLKKLIPFIHCDIVKKIHMVLLYGHEFRKLHLPIIDFVFKVFGSVSELHFGLSNEFVLTPRIKNEFEKKGYHIEMVTTGPNKNYLVVTK